MESSSAMLLADALSSSSSPIPGPPASRSTALLFKLCSADAHQHNPTALLEK